MTNLESAAADAQTASPGLIADLRPVIDFLAEAARRRAERIVNDAAAQADATIAEAQGRADAILAAARESGAALARQSTAALLADARRDARHIVLTAKRQVYEEACAKARERLCGLANTSEASALNARLGVLARERLGDDAEVTTIDGEIGIVARLGERSIDLGTDALLERTVASLGEVMGALWS